MLCDLIQTSLFSNSSKDNLAEAILVQLLRFKMLYLVQILMLVAMFQHVFSRPSDEHPPQILTKVTNGANLVELKNIVAYSDEEVIIFPFSDVPNPSKQLSNGCSTCHESIKNITGNNQQAIASLYIIMEKFHDMFSYKGLKAVADNDSNMTISTRYTDSNSDPEVSLPNEKAMKDLNEADVELIFKLFSKHGLLPKSGKSKRSIRTFVRKVVSAIRPLFVPKNQILSRILDMRNLLPSTFKALTNSKKMVSELTKAGNDALVTISNADDQAVHDVKLIQQPHLPIRQGSPLFKLLSDYFKVMSRESTNNFLVKNIMDGIGEIVLQVADNSNLLYTFVEYLLHLDAIQVCRDGSLPLNFAPPSLLKLRLETLAAQLPEGVELAILPTNVHDYYTLKNAKCFFDADGGTIELSVPVKDADTTFKVLEFSSVFFAWNQYTCSIGVEGGLIAMEEYSNRIYPISQIHQKDCNPSLGLCKVPLVGNSQWEDDYCVRSLLEGGNKKEVEASCRMICIEGNTTVISQIDEDTIIATHLPKSGSHIFCKDSQTRTPISHNYEMGAFRISLPYSCQLMTHSRVIAKSRAKYAKSGTQILVEHLLPAHWTDLSEWVVHAGEISNDVAFENAESIFDHNWRPHEFPISDNSWFPINFPLPSSLIQSVHSALLCYLLWKVNMIPVGLIDRIVNRVEAKTAPICQFPTDTTILLYIVLILMMLNMILTFFSCGRKRIKKIWERKVDVAAIKRVQGKSTTDDAA